MQNGLMKKYYFGRKSLLCLLPTPFLFVSGWSRGVQSMSNMFTSALRQRNQWSSSWIHCL